MKNLIRLDFSCGRARPKQSSVLKHVPHVLSCALFIYSSRTLYTTLRRLQPYHAALLWQHERLMPGPGVEYVLMTSKTRRLTCPTDTRVISNVLQNHVQSSRNVAADAQPKAESCSSLASSFFRASAKCQLRTNMSPAARFPELLNVQPSAEKRAFLHALWLHALQEI